LAIGTADVGTRGHFHDADLYPCGRGAVEADLQSTSSARLADRTWRTQRGCLRESSRGHSGGEGRMPDYMFLLESRLSPEQRAVMMRVQELSAAMGFNLYLTGGTVRDLITGASLRDLDFTVEG